MGMVIAAALGVFAWTWVEYVLHRFAGHWARGRNHFSREHLRHHGTPSYFSPLPQKVLSAVIVGPAVGAAVGLVLGPGVGVAFGAGFLVGYFAYEWVHWRIHVAPPRGRWSRWVRLHHLHHHFSDPSANHGVTTDLWDRVFRTHTAVGPVAVPRKRALPWMTDATGQLRPELAHDYALTDRGLPRAA